MKIIKYSLLFLLFCLFLSCILNTNNKITANSENNRHYSIYHECFYLGEESFLIEGAYFSDSSLNTPVLFDTLDFVLIDYNWNNESPILVWKSTATKISENGFHSIIDITKGKRNEDITPNNNKSHNFHNFITSHSSFPHDFSGYKLEFVFDGNIFIDELFVEENIKYSFVYVGKSIDLSRTFGYGTLIGWDYKTGNDPNTYWIHNMNLNFTKPGWYKVVTGSQMIENNSKYSLAKDSNIWFNLRY